MDRIRCYSIASSSRASVRLKLIYCGSRACVSNTIIDHFAACPHLAPSCTRLEDHLVGVLAVPQAEAGAQVCLKIRLLLDRRNQRLVNGLLVRNALGIDVLLLGCCLALLEEGILALAFFLLARPVLVLAHAVQDFSIEVRDVGGCAGRNYVAVVDAAQGNAVGLEGTSYQENALLELAEENNALAGEATGEEDEDGARLERLAVLGGVGGLAGLVWLAMQFCKLQLCFSLRLEHATAVLLILEFGAYLLHERFLLSRVVARGLLFTGCSRHVGSLNSRLELVHEVLYITSTSQYYLQVDCFDVVAVAVAIVLQAVGARVLTNENG